MSDINDNKFKSFCKNYLPYIVVLVLILLLKYLVVSPIRVNGDSMNKTLCNGDLMILDRISYRFSDIERFDIVVINDGDELLIKRIIGLPGEKITYKDNKLYINDKIIKDKYGSNKTNDFEAIVPKGKYFVLGDNRGNSMDSRYFGSFSKKSILGKTSFVFLPFDRVGSKD